MLIAAAASAGSDAAAQPAPVTLRYEQVATRPVPGASAALSLDPSRVGASAQDGVVTLIGRGPGSTNVVIVTGDDTLTLRVVVGEPPINRLPGMRDSNGRGAASGYYEAKYGSNPGVLQGGLFFSRRDGDRLAELTLRTATALGPALDAPFSIPQASFTIRTPGRELTVLDKVLANSPLTVSHASVRGLYLRQGPWQVNAGYSFFSTFEHLLLPTSKEAVAGVAYRQTVGPRTTLTPQLFLFRGAGSNQRGTTGTVLFETRTASDVKILAELGASRSPAAAFEIELDRPGRRAWAKLRAAPADLPSLTTDQQSGRQFEGGWFRQNDNTTITTNAASRRYSGGAVDQTSNVASFDWQRRLTRQWTIHAGSGLSQFESGARTATSVTSMTLPAGVSFATGHGGAGVDYQFSRETARDLGGHLIRGSLNGSARGFRLSGFVERQSQAPTAGRIFTMVPWLQPMLDRLGLEASTPQQLADLLRTNAELSAYGYANSVQIDLTPVRTRLGGTVGWSGASTRRPQLSMSTLFNRDQSIDRTATSAVHSLHYAQRLDGATELFVTWSALCHDRLLPSACDRTMFASLRRGLDRGPQFLAARGRIEGVVFRDEKALGVYAPEFPPVGGVEVILDNTHYTRTDAAGRFRFEGVTSGAHRVEARYSADQPTFFTTPSPTDADAGSTVYFGIARSRSSLRGVVLADAGGGIDGVLVRIVGADRRSTARTTDDGTFIVEALPSGEYEVSIDAGSVPAGYPVDSLTAQRVRVEKAEPGRARFVLRPYRSVTGRARTFDRSSGQYVAVAGATVELLPLGRTAVTDDAGQYVFRNLPAGRYTILARRNGRDNVAGVTVPEGPAMVKDVMLTVAPAEPSAASAAAPATTALFTIEVAESANARYARAMVAELNGAGHAAYLTAAIAGTGSYRVRVGRFESRAAADRSARALEKALGWPVSVTPISME